MNLDDDAECSLRVEDRVIQAFAEASQDRNPIHLDEGYAARTRFGRRIAHGMLSAALISSVIANQLPGPGTIYLSQTLAFRAPVFIGDTITARVVLKEALGRDRYRLETTVTRADGTLVVSGEAIVLAEGK
jgi:3-hydroxybutyryl-CoA dehydratase